MTKYARLKQGNLVCRIALDLRIEADVVEIINLGPPALEASTIPLGYRGGGEIISHCSCFEGMLNEHVHDFIHLHSTLPLQLCL